MRRTIAGIVLTLGALSGASARGQTFPATFAPLYCQRGVMIDGYRDQSGAIDDRDIVGTVDRPAGFRAVDAQFLYFRMRLDASPTQGNGLTPFAWGFELSTDGDPTSYEILISVDGASGTVRLYSNAVTTVPDSPTDPADQLIMTYPFAQNGRVVDAGPSIFGGGNDSFIDMAVPWTDLATVGLAPTSIVAIWTASSTNPDRLNGDFACHDGGGAANVPRLSQNPPAPIAADPTGSPGPGGGADGGGNLLGSSGIEGGPGCSCGVARSRQPSGAIGLLFAVGWIATRRRRSQHR
jgi:MYXO-CTERM domain-containing protein